MTSILVYVVDKKGKFDTNMTKILPSLYEESRDRITFPIKVSRVYVIVSRSRFVCNPSTNSFHYVIIKSKVTLLDLDLFPFVLRNSFR